VIIANVGAGAQDVVVGKNILRIGTLVIPALPAVVALVALVVGVALGLWFSLVPATMPDGYVNIAIADFGQIDADGRMRVTADSQRVGETLFATVRDEVTRLAPDYRGQVWHDSMSLLEKRGSIGMISGLTPDLRSPGACQRATDLHANIIVYGALDTRSTPAQLSMELCARNPNRDRDAGTYDELQQFDRLGGPLTVNLPLQDVQGSVNAPLRVRTTLVAKLVVGLRYELADAPNYASNLRKALGVFNEALAYLQAQDGAASAENGGDVVYYFIGREHFLLAQDPATPASDKPAELEAARAGFARAVELNGTYGRALNGLGGVYFHLAQSRPPAERLHSNELGQALDAYTRAIAAAQARKDRLAQAEAHTALALTLRLQAEALMTQATPDNAAAAAALGRADGELDAATPLLPAEQNRIRGVAAMARGLVAHQRAQLLARTKAKTAAIRASFQGAIDAYQQCISAGLADPGDLFLKRQIIDFTCRPRQESARAALARLPQ
jgi:tetratricopeptide (TPR) repeat protein